MRKPLGLDLHLRATRVWNVGKATNSQTFHGKVTKQGHANDQSGFERKRLTCSKAMNCQSGNSVATDAIFDLGRMLSDRTKS
jgi:hypothetical protein